MIDPREFNSVSVRAARRRPQTVRNYLVESAAERAGVRQSSFDSRAEGDLFPHLSFC